MRLRTHRLALAGVMALVAARAASPQQRPEPPAVTPEMLDALVPLPAGLGPLPQISPAPDPARVALGRQLFFTRKLSGDETVSCATCHQPRLAFTDGRRTATGFGGKILRRNSPTILNSAFNEPQFWDGRVSGLEAQATGPMTSPDEMNMPGPMIAARLSEDPSLNAEFHRVFGGAPTIERVADALAAFERTIVTSTSRFDIYARGDKAALTDTEKRGLLLFVGKASCTQCHLGANFTDNQFHRLGIDTPTDPGRYEVTKREEDRGAFKTPGLRNVEKTAPYMHDGSVATLEEAIELYDTGGRPGTPHSTKIFPLGLTAAEKTQLLAFLKTLTDLQSASFPEEEPAQP